MSWSVMYRMRIESEGMVLVLVLPSVLAIQLGAEGNVCTSMCTDVYLESSRNKSRADSLFTSRSLLLSATAYAACTTS